MSRSPRTVRWETPPIELTLDWKSSGEELMTHLISSVDEFFGSRSYEATTWGAPEREMLIEFAPRELDTWLRIFVNQDARSVLLTVGSSEESPITSSIESWERTIASSLEQMGRAVETVEWEAIIGESPMGRGGDAFFLGAPCTVGPFRLEDVGNPHFEMVRTSFSSATTRRSHPIYVRGASTAVDRDFALQSARSDLYDLCALLTVEWDSRAPWILRDEPRPLSWGRMPVPLVDPFLKDQEEGKRISDRNWSAPRELAQPSWTDLAWSIARCDTGLRRALHAFYEAERLESQHPSYALIGYVGALETVGAHEGVKGEQARMRAALRRVVGEEEARQVVDRFYGRRSATGHGGKLHGEETWFGLRPAGPTWTFDEARMFVWREVPRIRGLTRRVLESVLSLE